jgi:hypothetical protein
LVLSYHSLLGTQIVQCTPTPEDYLAPLPFTPGILVLLSLPRRSSAGPCCLFLLSRFLGFHSRGPLSIPIGLHGLVLFLLSICVACSVLLTPTDSYRHFLTWPLLVLPTPTDSSLIHSSGPCDVCTTTPQFIHMVPVARCNYHGLFFTLIYSFSRKHSMFRTLVVAHSVCLLIHSSRNPMPIVSTITDY